MTPDPTTIVRRRHLARTLYRAGLLILIAYFALGFLPTFASQAWELFNGSWSNGGHYFLREVFSFLAHVGFLVALGVLEKPIIRWLVPLDSSDNLCPSCGYSLKNLKSPICPECGTNLT